MVAERDARSVNEQEAPDPIAISALQHWSYCPRQCGLIHLEQTFSENLCTVRGRHAHERADQPGNETRRGARIERALPLWSRRLGLTGKADTVEFVGDVPYPVEYKVGGRKAGGHDEVQLAAQALCLEEMLGVAVPRGALYYHASRQRQEVAIDAALRGRVEETVAAIRAMLASGALPPAPNDSRCPKCSLIDSCLPGVVGGNVVGAQYLARLFATEG